MIFIIAKPHGEFRHRLYLPFQQTHSPCFANANR
jgi:hypothetical protein